METTSSCACVAVTGASGYTRTASHSILRSSSTVKSKRRLTAAYEIAPGFPDPSCLIGLAGSNAQDGGIRRGVERTTDHGQFPQRDYLATMGHIPREFSVRAATPKGLPHGQIPAECSFWQHVGYKHDKRLTNRKTSQLTEWTVGVGNARGSFRLCVVTTVAKGSSQL